MGIECLQLRLSVSEQMYRVLCFLFCFTIPAFTIHPEECPLVMVAVWIFYSCIHRGEPNPSDKYPNITEIASLILYEAMCQWVIMTDCPNAAICMSHRGHLSETLDKVSSYQCQDWLSSTLGLVYVLRNVINEVALLRLLFSIPAVCVIVVVLCLESVQLREDAS